MWSCLYNLSQLKTHGEFCLKTLNIYIHKIKKQATQQLNRLYKNRLSTDFGDYINKSSYALNLTLQCLWYFQIQLPKKSSSQKKFSLSTLLTNCTGVPKLLKKQQQQQSFKRLFIPLPDSMHMASHTRWDQLCLEALICRLNWNYINKALRSTLIFG